MAAAKTESWREFLEREQRHDLRVRTYQSNGVSTSEDVDLHKVNPYSGQRPFFVRGLANMFSNDSKQTRMLLTPCSECPLRSPRHAGLMIATRAAVERLPKEEQRQVNVGLPEMSPLARYQGGQGRLEGQGAAEVLGMPRSRYRLPTPSPSTAKSPRTDQTKPKKLTYGKLLLAM
mmetsp:Transcript_27072/g.62607  ORF Transcript_27072/g.62607 Transcript_27072/m.62607 type:complete len:175 (+) Transcript_27072:59-583(+)|eukprot:1346825-Amphidinium_carterae.2